MLRFHQTLPHSKNIGVEHPLSFMSRTFGHEQNVWAFYATSSGAEYCVTYNPELGLLSNENDTNLLACENISFFYCFIACISSFAPIFQNAATKKWVKYITKPYWEELAQLTLKSVRFGQHELLLLITTCCRLTYFTLLCTVHLYKHFALS